MSIKKVVGKKNKQGQQLYNVRVNYTDSFGIYKQRTKTAYGLQEAKMLEVSLLNEKKEPETALVFAELYKLYYDSKKFEVRETSLDSINSSFQQHILPYFGNIKVTRINAKNLTAWKSYIYEKQLSVVTNQRVYSALRSLLTWAVKSGHIKESPMKFIDNFKDAYSVPERDKMRYYTAEQFKVYISKVLEVAESTHDFNYYVFFNIAFYTGMRKGEINALTWSDIKDNKINITKSIAQKLKGEDRITPPKNRSSYRSLQMPLALIKILDQHKERLVSAHNFSSTSFICSNNGGSTCLRDTSIDKQNRKYAELANLERITIHDFRHTHATLLANSNINIQEIARRLGHSNIEETWNTYSHLYPHEEEKAIEILDNI